MFVVPVLWFSPTDVQLSDALVALYFSHYDDPDLPPGQFMYSSDQVSHLTADTLKRIKCVALLEGATRTDLAAELLRCAENIRQLGCTDREEYQESENYRPVSEEEMDRIFTAVSPNLHTLRLYSLRLESVPAR